MRKITFLSLGEDSFPWGGEDDDTGLGFFCQLVQHDWEFVVSGSASVLTGPLQISYLQLTEVISHAPKPPMIRNEQLLHSTCAYKEKAFSRAESTVYPGSSFPLQRTFYTKHLAKAPEILP